MKLRLLAVTSIFVLAVTSYASAADIAPVYKAPPQAAQPFNWTGFYVGGNAGAAWTNASVSTAVCETGPGCYWPSLVNTAGSAVNGAGTGSIKETLFTGGAQAGFNWQVGAFVLGAEADINSFKWNASRVGVGLYIPSTGAFGMTLTDSVSTDWLATMRGRLGYANGNLLLYVTGGAAFSRVHHEYFDGEFGFGNVQPYAPACGGRFNGNYCSYGSNNLKTGWTLGGGGEWALNRNWTIKAEYLYVNFGNAYSESALRLGDGSGQRFDGGVGQKTLHAFDFSTQIARVGINYKFDWGKAPVLAKY